MREGNGWHFFLKPSLQQELLNRFEIAVCVHPIVLVADQRSTSAFRMDPEVVPRVAFEKVAELVEEIDDLVLVHAVCLVLHGFKPFWWRYEKIDKAIGTGKEGKQLG